MKKQGIRFLLVVLLVVTGMQSAFAQLQFDNSLPSVSSPVPAVANKVLTAFDRLFKKAVEPEWFRANRNYVVNFVQNGQKCKAEFMPGGQLLYDIIYGKEKEMPVDLRSLVKSTYFDYSIDSTVKIE